MILIFVEIINFILFKNTNLFIMRNITSLVAYFIIGLCISVELNAADGDTIHVRTIEFQDRREGWYNFPDHRESFQRIMLHFTLRCPPGKQCGEWDYISKVFINRFFAPSYQVDGKSPEQFSFMKDTSWSFSRKLIDGEWKTIKTPQSATTLYLFDIDSENPTKFVDSIIVWHQYYDNYIFDDAGKAIDSTLVEPDSTIYLAKKRVYFNDRVTISERVELMRFITPYGNGLNLGQGFTWTLDVTDFKDLITGKVHLSSPNGGWGDPSDQNDQEDLQLTFSFIKGTPPRDIINKEEILRYISVIYDKDFESKVPAFDYTFSESEKAAKLIVIQTGHGFGGNNDNCAEFCRKEAYIKVDGKQTHSQWIWRDCGIIPLYPQGGTWLIDRTNWCPGAEVVPHEYEITPFIKSGSSSSIDYDMEYYNTPWTQGSNHAPVWVISTYLVTYGEHNFMLDARIDDIIAPTRQQMHLRFNPIFTNPIIQIRNTGKHPIKSIKLKYGNNPDRFAEYLHEFQEELLFDKTSIISLPNNSWYFPDSPNLFVVEIVEVNDVADDYAANNIGRAFFDKNSSNYHKNFVIELTTNNSEVLGINSPYNWTLYDDKFNVVYERPTTQNNTKYTDTVNLLNGNYRFILRNPAGYGLGFWFYNRQLGLNNGSLRFTKGGTTLRNFPVDFGDFIIHEFTVTDKPTVISSVKDNEINFGSVMLGDNKILSIVFYPENSAGVIINDASLFFAEGKKFEITEIRGPGNKFPYHLNLGDSLFFILKFEPTSLGNKNAQMRISTNDQLNSNMVYNLIGTGSDATNIDEYSSDSEIRVNYQGGTLYFTLPKYSEPILNISIIDLLGRTLNKINTNELHTIQAIHLEGIAKGVYFSCFEYMNGRTVCEKFIID